MLLLTPRAEVLSARGPITLAFTFRSMFEFEVKTGLEPGGGGKPDIEIINLLLWSMVIPFHPSLDVDDVGAMWDIADLPRVFTEASMLMRASSTPRLADQPAWAPEPVIKSKQNWLDLWACGRIVLHLSEPEFWNLTPRMFHFLFKKAVEISGGDTLALETVEERNQRLLVKMSALFGGQTQPQAVTNGR